MAEPVSISSHPGIETTFVTVTNRVFVMGGPLLVVTMFVR